MTKGKLLQEVVALNKSVMKGETWKTSWVRMVLIALVAWILTVIFMRVFGVDNSNLEVIVPVVVLALSKLMVEPVRKFWEKYKK